MYFGNTLFDRQMLDQVHWSQPNLLRGKNYLLPLQLPPATVFNEYPKHCQRTWPSLVCKTLCWALVVNLDTYSKWNPHWPAGKKKHTQWKWTRITSTPSRVMAATSRAIDIVICEPPPYQFQVASQKGNHYCSYQSPIWNNPEIITQL